ncbi:MAG TPA: Gfo/Idh/MocA family oxidoreductase [bacterium]|nr:Gfo/Idh/MocA family oxidoreductase [bacterium]
MKKTRSDLLNQSNWSRRKVITALGAGATTAALGPLILTSANASPNARIRHAVIGSGGQGRSHCKQFSGIGADCCVAAICDVDPDQRRRALEVLPQGSPVAEHEDYRRILDDQTIQTISIATPDHWHTKIAIEAILAGKHVYVEKPCCHNIHEGNLLVRAAQKYGKCVQHGTQSRSSESVRNAIQFLRDGKLGNVRMAKAINHQLRKPIGRALESDPPTGVNYDLWLGPAPKVPFTKNRWHYNWHWFWDYGTGDMGNDGIHQVDIARWGLGVEFPDAVTAAGGQLFYDDDHETPDTQVVTLEYDHCYLLYEMRLWTDYQCEGHDNGTIFFGDLGKLEVGRRGCFVTLIDKEPEQIPGQGVSHARNFIDSVIADDPSKLNAPISEGFISATLCHLGNIGTRVGQRLHFDKEYLRFPESEEATRLCSRDYRDGYQLPVLR